MILAFLLVDISSVNDVNLRAITQAMLSYCVIDLPLKHNHLIPPSLWPVKHS